VRRRLFAGRQIVYELPVLGRVQPFVQALEDLLQNTFCLQPVCFSAILLGVLIDFTH
jgi:hypothetical protein